MTDNITELRPKPKDPTGAQRQARYRKKRNGIVTVPAISASSATIAHPIPTPPPLAGRDVAPVTAPRNGGTGITVATLTAALSLPTVSGGFSIYGMRSIFTRPLYPVAGMALARDLRKLSALARLRHQRS